MFKNIFDLLLPLAIFDASYLIMRIFQAPNSDPDHALEPDPMANPKVKLFT
jgi:hypothetical protein